MAKRIGLFLEKVGHTAIFDNEGKRIPITLLHLRDSFIISKKTKDIHGYDAVVLGVEASINLKKPQSKILEKSKITAKCKIFESRVDNLGDVVEGAKVSITHFVKDQYVDITGYSLGKGFAGVMKRHNFKGLKASHGVSIAHRSQGSTGQCQDPGRVYKGKKMAGQLGNSKVTVQNLKVILVDQERSLLGVRGNNIPGAKGSYVFVKDAVKKSVPKGSFPICAEDLKLDNVV
ncbi:50S ribosomal protein L3 [Ehrlichia chaffeensis str. Heartland]|uniref:50S ribosomal protein L3 n=1 Tax=Ehrlichia chaffeensis (strain ATCC CRL-10679 / Arkansas) TaxID=205920 RepID=Q2GH56_EHRCR|nr:50S ribosomal protein L3 [Ehrlichia chaffeensis]ABD45271.1 ribosomal protein L3 [Ehrlichia chaffeensis str. Arkansas]AHX03511.1 50S ribosomal protein L3 [Ehrlichia chaffeensis str. Heartland]AHX05768.1 50S ribosomal protein L3 [Ehrlichia chaffeensis str. Jax]AHX07940.1 50S ribosomal protein L3 [Ehrlichia chaffeensis str. Osceola]AHX08550.1 50S ribosomal protein L3 [Ehrlichia chaffeensis str. Saint Vincent]